MHLKKRCLIYAISLQSSHSKGFAMSLAQIISSHEFKHEKRAIRKFQSYEVFSIVTQIMMEYIDLEN